MKNPEFLEQLLTMAASQTPRPHLEAGVPSLLRPYCDLLWSQGKRPTLTEQTLTINAGGLTPIHDAVLWNSFEMVLVEHGADPLVKNQWGSNCVDSLKKFPHPRGNIPRADRKYYDQLLQEFRKKGWLE